MRAPPSPATFTTVQTSEGQAAKATLTAARQRIRRDRKLKPQTNNLDTAPEKRPDDWPYPRDPMICLCCGRALTVHTLTEHCYR